VRRLQVDALADRLALVVLREAYGGLSRTSPHIVSKLLSQRRVFGRKLDADARIRVLIGHV
jgi:hypothetical protein